MIIQLNLKTHTHYITGIESLQFNNANTGNLTFQPLFNMINNYRRPSLIIGFGLHLTQLGSSAAVYVLFVVFL